MAGKPKPAGETYNARLILRLPSEQLDALKAEAEARGKSVSAYARQVLCTRRVVIKNDIYLNVDELQEATRQLARVGNNLNQIAHRLNCHREMDPRIRTDATATLRDVREAARKLTDIATTKLKGG